jgi:hypothetical protein
MEEVAGRNWDRKLPSPAAEGWWAVLGDVLSVVQI